MNLKIYLICYILINLFGIITGNECTIIVKITESGTHQIYNKAPKELYINNAQYEIQSNKLYQLNETNNITLKYDNLDNCKEMFSGCSNIEEIDFSNCDTSSVTTMEKMFSGCTKLNSLNLINIDTSKVANMDSMFYNCCSLNSLDLSNFNTSKVNSMTNMFRCCSSLISVNLNSFDTSKATNMCNMFWDCSSLISLDLSNFDTSQNENFGHMFANCTKLLYLNLSNFIISKAKYLDNIFNGCSSLRYINIENFSINPSVIIKTEDMFKGISENITICYKNDNSDNNGILNQIMNISNNNIIICSVDFFFEETNIYINASSILSYSSEINTFSEIQSSELVINNNTNFFEQTNISINVSSILSFNNDISIFSEIKSFDLVINNNNSNIYDNITELEKIIQLYLDFCDINEIKNEICFVNYTSNETNIYYEDIILKAIDKDLTSIKFNTSSLDNGIDDIFIYNNKTTYTLTTSNNQKNNYNANISSVDLGQCDLLLREHYNISENENLYIRKIDVAQDGMKIPKIEFDIYAKLNNSNLEKINNVKVNSLYYILIKLNIILIK